MTKMYDAIIIGSGIAGLTTALKLAEKKWRVCILSRGSDLSETNTFYAQGGIIYDHDESQTLADDIQRASSFTASDEAINLLIKRSASIVEEILIHKVKTPFTRDSSPEPLSYHSLMKTKEAAHSMARIIYKGDYTGKSIQQSLLQYLQKPEWHDWIEFFDSHTAVDLITPNHHGKSLKQRYEENRVVGVYVFNQKTKLVETWSSKVTILATGGIAALYQHHSNSMGARGDGHAMAKRAQAQLVNMEFIQFHPTTLYDPSSHRRFLISEAVRGEGGILLNSSGQAFMESIHPEKDLAPRDVVARAILNQMILERQDCMYLDISFKQSDWVKERFPTIYHHCLERGLDMTKEPIPVVPAAHYTCGGVKTNLSGETTLKGLYAVGEVACTGLHGANRLASTSLLEGLTWGYLAAEDIVQKSQHSAWTFYPPEGIRQWEQATGPCALSLIHQDWQTLKQTMWNYVGLSRSPKRLRRALAMVMELDAEVQAFYKHAQLHDELIGLRNGLEVALSVIKSSMRNKQSMGCFYLEND